VQWISTGSRFSLDPLISDILQYKGVKRHISGVLMLDKPPDISSNRALQAAKRLFLARKAGHTGTLDPMATGLLPICLGEATKFSSELLSADKHYEATLILGYASTTGDAEGEISIARDGQRDIQNMRLEISSIKSVLRSFIGPISQTPPMYSAIKVRGKPLYAYAREGVELPRKPREIHIHDLQMLDLARNEMRIRVKCSSGTYIRTLGEDIGVALGYGGAYLAALRRVALGDFDISRSHPLSELEEMSLPQRDAHLLPVDRLLQRYPAAVLGNESVAALLYGRRIREISAGFYSENEGITEGGSERLGGFPDLKEGQKLRLYDRGNGFLGLGEITPEMEIAPVRLVSRML
jgi:tRNA pseudouridine55 synthase